MLLVLLHGFTHTGASWEPVREKLGGRYRVIAPDIRGHGAAAGAEPAALDEVVADVVSLAGREQFVLGGYSMGGRIALHVALALGPERVRRLVLIGASPGLAEAVERAARRAEDEELAAKLERMAIEELADHWASSTAVLASQPASVRDAARADRLRNTPAGLARALRGLGTGALPSLWGRLGELTMPVTLIVGERDQKFRATAERMALLLGGPTEVVVVQGAGHAAHLEAPAAVAEAIGSQVPFTRTSGAGRRAAQDR